MSNTNINLINQCHICGQIFKSSQRLKSHLNKKIPCQPNEKIKIISSQIKLRENSLQIFCPHCNKKFVRKDNLSEHLKKNRCLTLRNNQSQNTTTINIDQLKDELKAELMAEFEQKSQMFEKQIAELKEKPIINNMNNQILQIVCVGQNDNYLDILTQQYGNFELALEFIKDCALSQLTGDCKLINKIYFESQQNQSSIKFLDKKRTKIEYFNEKKEKISDSKEMFGRRIANNLQNSYLKGVNHLINKNLESRGCPNKFLDDYDIQEWNSHIYNLSDEKYQKKIVNQLNIPLQ